VLVPVSDASETFDVVVVGGGIAGLTTAIGLRDAALRTIVLERDALLGGRASSWADPVTGDPVHIGPHIFLDQYPNFFALLDVCGTRDRVVWEQDGAFVTMVDGERAIPIRRSGLPPPYHYVPSLLADPEVSVADLVSNWPIIELALRADEAAVARLDALDARTLLLDAGVTPRFVARFWAFTALAIMNVPLERCSAGALLRFYRYLLGHDDLRVGFAAMGLGDVYAPACRAILERSGAEVRTRAAVREVLTGDDRGVTGVRLDDGRTIRAPRVVLALPPTTLGQLARREWSELSPFRDLGRFRPVPYIAPYLWLDRKVTRRQFWARVWREGDYNCDFYDLSNIHRGWRQRPSIITSNVIGSDRIGDATDDEIIARTLAELTEHLPDVARAELLHARVHRIPMAIHAPEPGTEGLRPPVRTAIEGLFLAGDWIATAIPASMESAAASGWMAAEAILSDVGRPRRLVQERPPARGLVPWLTRNIGRVPFKRPPAHLRALVSG
jgi:15-cis-phytoene desaturase